MVFVHVPALPKGRSGIKRKGGISTRAAASSAPARGKKHLPRKDPFCADAPNDPQNAPPRQVGYIRVSTSAQITDRQVAALEAACSELHIEHISGAAIKRPVFDAIRAGLRRGDTLVVSDLDRAFRSAVDAILTAEDLRRRGVHFRIQRLHLDTDSLEGELFFNILAAFAQFERRIISRRTREGLAAARVRGVRLGRPALLPAETVHEAHDWLRMSGLPCRYVAALLGVSRQTLQRAFHREGLRYPILPKPILTQKGDPL